MDKTEFTGKRFADLSRQAANRDIVTFSDFLNLNEINILHKSRSELSTGYQLFGGYELAERQMAAFLPDALCYEWDYPISLIHLTPVQLKFAEDLSHRDVLGAVMNLGIERHMTGDILLKKSDIYIFCTDKIAPVIAEELTRIRHTSVAAEILELSLSEISLAPELLNLTGIVSSNRLDNLAACFCGCSRSVAADLIKAAKVAVNGAQIISTSVKVKSGDIISIRGYGKFVFCSEDGETKKGRVKIHYQKYI